MSVGESLCPRVRLRMECPECEYPYSEAMIPLDKRIKHLEAKKCPNCGNIEFWKAMTDGMPENYYYCWKCKEEFN